MKILFLNSFSAVQGGAERLLHDTVTTLQRLGHSCCLIIANDDRWVKSTEVWPGRTNRYYIPELLVPLTNGSAFKNYRKNKKYKNTVRYMQDIIDIENPDVIHIHNFPSIEIIKDLNIHVPLIKTVHSYENLCRSRMKTLPGGAICQFPMGEKCAEICDLPNTFLASRIRAENRLLKNKFSKIVAISSWIQRVLLLNGFPNSKIAVIPNFTNAPQRHQQPLPEENEVLFVGRVTPEKGLHELVHAISQTRTKPVLHILGANGLLGQNAYEQEMISHAKKYGISVKVSPWAEKDALSQAYARAKIIAFSSTWPEPFGLVGIEAMLHGKPVIGFDTGGVKDWLMDGVTGFLVPHLSTSVFATRIDQLIADNELRRQMGEAGRQHVVNNFSATRYMKQLINLYKEAIHEYSSH